MSGSSGFGSKVIYRFSAMLAAAMLILTTGCSSTSQGTQTNTGEPSVFSTEDTTGISADPDSTPEESAAATDTVSSTAPVAEDFSDAAENSFTWEEGDAVSAEASSIWTEGDAVSTEDAPAAVSASAGAAVEEDGIYYSKDEVSLYLHEFHKLPSNYITKKEARALGWEGGPLEPYAPGKAIGGDVFGNYEGLLPEDTSYHECDIDTKGTSRGAKRLVWSTDWDIYYTEDHYETFTLLYTEEDP